MKEKKRFIVGVTQWGEYYIDLKTFSSLYPKGNQVNVYIGDMEGALLYLSAEIHKLTIIQKTQNQ